MTPRAQPTMTAAPTAPRDDLQPVATDERIVLLDVLRGFTLYGVLLANMIPLYSGRAFLSREAIESQTGPLDKVARFLVHTFIDGKSLALLSLLFGLGFAVQLARGEARGRTAVPLYLRRLVVLLVIGFCHVIFLWWGDILWGYAIAGFGLVLLRRRSDRALLIWAAILLFVVPFVTAIPAVSERLGRIAPNPFEDAAHKAELLATFRGHDHVRLMRAQVHHATRFVASISFWYFPWTLGRFLLGYVVGRRRLLHDVAEHLPRFRKLLWWGLGLGLGLGVSTHVVQLVLRSSGGVSPGVRLAMQIPEEIGVLATASAYVAAIALLMQRPAWQRRLSILAPVGRMALTTYLSQSLICTFLFYGWGLGLIGRVGPALCIPLTLTIFAGQVLASRWWLRRFRFGPVEWVWRSATYGKVQPMRALARPLG